MKVRAGSEIVLLDSGPLGSAANPRGSESTLQCRAWLDKLLQDGVVVVIPEIADYEVRRELLRADKFTSIRRLDRMKTSMHYLPLTTEVMLQAAELWAATRKIGRPTSHPHALDGDVILAAQAEVLRCQGYFTVVATTNIGHFSRFVPASHWREITSE
jgi:predicted nucleic acid-binding protein